MTDRICPACSKEKPLTSFDCLPIDDRCNECIPVSVSMGLYDDRINLAGQKMAQIIDAKQVSTLKPVERLLSDAYEEFGGSRTFAHYLVKYIQNLAEAKKYGAAVTAMMKMLQLHAKIDHMKMEDDWKSMDDATLRDTLRMKMLALMAEVSSDNKDKKASAIKTLMGND